MSDTTAIAIENLHQSIKVGFTNKTIKVLHDINFSVNKGDIFGFIGGNGAGKSTTIKTLIGVLRPTKGCIKIFGQNPKYAKNRAQIGYLPEVPRLPQNLTPLEILKQFASLHLIPKNVTQTRIEEILDKVSMSEHCNKLIGTFSKGMQQRIAVACALIHDPDLLIFDEPMSGLDPMGRHLIRNIMLEQKALGKSILFSSHILSDVEALASHIALLHKGRLVTNGSLSEVLPKQQHSTIFNFKTPKELSAEQKLELNNQLENMGKLSLNADILSLEVLDCGDSLKFAQNLEQKFSLQIEEIRKNQKHLEEVIVEITQNIA